MANNPPSHEDLLLENQRLRERILRLEEAVSALEARAAQAAVRIQRLEEAVAARPARPAQVHKTLHTFIKSSSHQKIIHKIYLYLKKLM